VPRKVELSPEHRALSQKIRRRVAAMARGLYRFYISRGYDPPVETGRLLAHNDALCRLQRVGWVMLRQAPLTAKASDDLVEIFNCFRTLVILHRTPAMLLCLQRLAPALRSTDGLVRLLTTCDTADQD